MSVQLKRSSVPMLGSIDGTEEDSILFQCIGLLDQQIDTFDLVRDHPRRPVHQSSFGQPHAWCGGSCLVMGPNIDTLHVKVNDAYVDDFTRGFDAVDGFFIEIDITIGWERAQIIRTQLIGPNRHLEMLRRVFHQCLTRPHREGAALQLYRFTIGIDFSKVGVEVVVICSRTREAEQTSRFQ